MNGLSTMQGEYLDLITFINSPVFGLIICIGYVYDYLKILDVMSLGRDEAINLGVDYDKMVKKYNGRTDGRAPLKAERVQRLLYHTHSGRLKRHTARVPKSSGFLAWFYARDRLRCLPSGRHGFG